MTFEKIILPFILSACSLFTAFAQGAGEGRVLNRTFLLGVGASDIIETYLSPYKYSGIDYRMSFDSEKESKSGLSSLQHSISLDYSKASNSSERGSCHAGFLDYSFAYLRKIVTTDRLHGKAGFAPDLLVGAIYNTRNDNNPVEAKLNLNLDFAGRMDYRFRVKQMPLLLSYELKIPVLGAGFSPDYGQSYYEIFELGNRSNIVHFLSLHNQWTMKNRLMLEIPLRKNSLKIGYLFNIYQTRISNIETSVLNQNFLIGISGDILYQSRKKRLQSNSF